MEAAKIMLKLKKEDYEKILDHCRKGLPNESCGLLGGTIEDDVKTIEKVYLLTNIDESNEHFSMDPKEQLSAIKDIRQNGYQMIGNFHSHPESPSRPSEEDKRHRISDPLPYGCRKPGAEGLRRRQRKKCNCT